MSDLNNKLFICTIIDVTPFFPSGTIFSFKQYGRLIHATIKGENIKNGELVGLINKQGILEYSLNYQLLNHKVNGGVGTLKSCGKTGTSFKGIYSATNVQETFECSFKLERVSLQNQIAWRKKKSC
ncbi:hypothetical protein M3175_08565 [Robertmurraya korlensis]|uniref:hypothetical protein n=1 Tax=Robertmurraya korlensis TaxID=519977 RepID=UPI002040CCEF|nr:hypothetical protein [Robertmurraya korlensis]MCM3600781.1 hypothetical protein [Robertmurraya korlensis]